MTSVAVPLTSRPTGVPAGTAAADLLATDLAARRRQVEAVENDAQPG